MKDKFTFKKVYLLALVHLISIGLYLVSMVFCSDAILYFAEYGFTSEIYLALGIFLSMTVLWAYCGFLFSRSKTPIGISVLIGNALPILTTAIFFVLYIVYKANGSEDLLSVAGLIGGLGVGSFGILGEVVFMIFADTSVLLQIFVSFAACVIVFMLGYAVGGPVARKDKAKVIKELEEERLRKEKKKAAKANAKKK